MPLKNYTQITPRAAVNLGLFITTYFHLTFSAQVMKMQFFVLKAPKKWHFTCSFMQNATFFLTRGRGARTPIYGFGATKHPWKTTILSHFCDSFGVIAHPLHIQHPVDLLYHALPDRTSGILAYSQPHILSSLHGSNQAVRSACRRFILTLKHSLTYGMIRVGTIMSLQGVGLPSYIDGRWCG